MSEISKYEAQKKRLDGICEENNLVAIFRHDRYPMTLTIKPLTGLDEQMTMLENVEDNGYTSPDASLVFTVRDGVLSYKTSETFTISKPLFSKIENVFKKMHDYWLQFFFRDLMEKHVLTKDTMPTIASEDIPEDAEPLESYEDEEDGPDNDGEQLPCDGEDEVNEGVPVSLEDPDIKAAVSIVRANNTASISLLQHEMGATFSKAQKLLDALEELGVVSPFNGSKPREVLPADEPEDAPESDYEYETGEGEVEP